MGSCTEVVLSLGGDHYRGREDLLEYIGAKLPESVSHIPQKLHLVAGKEIAEDLPGSAQAGTTRVYTALLRKASETALIEYLEAAPWQGYSAILITESDSWGIPTITHLGATPSGY